MFRLIVAVRLEPYPINLDAGTSKRVVLTGTSRPGQRLLWTPLNLPPISESVLRNGIIWVQVEGTPEFSLGLGPLPLVFFDVCKQHMRFGQFRIQFQCFTGCDLHLRAELGRATAHKNCAEFCIGGCEADVCRRKRRVSPDGLLETTDTLF